MHCEWDNIENIFVIVPRSIQVLPPSITPFHFTTLRGLRLVLVSTVFKARDLLTTESRAKAQRLISVVTRQSVIAPSPLFPFNGAAKAAEWNATRDQ